MAMVAAIATMAVGTAVSVAGQLSASAAAARAQAAQGERDQRTAEAQARLRERDAALNRRAATEEALAVEADVETLTRQFERLRGRQVATTAARGLELRGSPLEVMAATADESQREIDRVRFASTLRQRELEEGAEVAEFEADELRTGGLDALRLSRARQTATRRAGILGAVGTGLGGAGRVLLTATRP